MVARKPELFACSLTPDRFKRLFSLLGDKKNGAHWEPHVSTGVNNLIRPRLARSGKQRLYRPGHSSHPDAWTNIAGARLRRNKTGLPWRSQW